MIIATILTETETYSWITSNATAARRDCKTANLMDGSVSIATTKNWLTLNAVKKQITSNCDCVQYIFPRSSWIADSRKHFATRRSYSLAHPTPGAVSRFVLVGFLRLRLDDGTRGCGVPPARFFWFDGNRPIALESDGGRQSTFRPSQNVFGHIAPDAEETRAELRSALKEDGEQTIILAL